MKSAKVSVSMEPELLKALQKGPHPISFLAHHLLRQYAVRNHLITLEAMQRAEAKG